MRTAHNRNDGSSNNLGVLLVRNGVGIAPHGLTDLQKVGDVPLPWHPRFHRSCTIVLSVYYGLISFSNEYCDIDTAYVFRIIMHHFLFQIRTYITISTMKSFKSWRSQLDGHHLLILCERQDQNVLKSLQKVSKSQKHFFLKLEYKRGSLLGNEEPDFWGASQVFDFFLLVPLWNEGNKSCLNELKLC